MESYSDKMLLISGSDLEIDAERRGHLVSQQYRLEHEGAAKEATRAQKPPFDLSSTTRRRNGVTPDREDESLVYYRYREAPM
jgi:hypothetical protein